GQAPEPKRFRGLIRVRGFVHRVRGLVRSSESARQSRPVSGDPSAATPQWRSLRGEGPPGPTPGRAPRTRADGHDAGARLRPPGPVTPAPGRTRAARGTACA